MSIIAISDAFKRHQQKAIWSIISFILLYIILIILAVALTLLCGLIAVWLISSAPHLVTLALGIGLASMGVLVLIFLLKFIFKKNKTDRSHLLEITRDEEPRFFALLDDIVTKTDTLFPKKVYLSMDVNAAVFYNSSFWSMFFPVRKNLQIGVGLINTTTQKELKAILAHEFGHFSQSSMKVSSYVYMANKIIYNLLYENNDYDKILTRWGSISGYFVPFVKGAIGTANLLQKILQKMYERINREHLALSREMEFHADAIAAAITGHKPIETSLLRSELAATSYENVISFYNGKYSEGLVSRNIYPQQLWSLGYLANKINIESKNHLPVVTLETNSRHASSKLMIENQWASHPSHEDRIASVKRYNETAGTDDFELANLYFERLLTYQEYFTGQLFNIEYKAERKEIDLPTFQKLYIESDEKNSFHPLYNSYYNDKNPELFDIKDENGVSAEPTELFNDSIIQIVTALSSLNEDIQTLQQIENNEIKLKTFDYDGKRYEANQSSALIGELQRQKIELEDTIRNNDLRIQQAFHYIAVKNEETETLSTLRNNLKKLDDSFRENIELYIDVFNKTQFMSEHHTFDDIKKEILSLYAIEKKLKEQIVDILADENIKDDVDTETYQSLEKYINARYLYFMDDSYFENELDHLSISLHNYYFLVYRQFFLKKKELLDFQVRLFMEKEALDHL